MTKVSGPRRFPTSAGVVSYRVSADGERVVYGDGVGFAVDDTPISLFGAPTDGSSPAVALGPATGVLQSYLLDPTGRRVVYFQRNVDDELFSVPALGGPPVLLSPGVRPRSYAATPDGTRVVFTAHAGGNRALCVRALDGSTALELVCAVTTGSFGDANLRVTPDSARVVFETLGTSRDLFSVALDGSEPAATRLAPTYTDDAGSRLEVTPDGSRVVYLADTGTGRADLFSVPTSGGSAPVLLSGALPANRDVTAFALGAGGQRVVYLADALVNEQFELFSVPVDGSQAPVRLNRAPVTSGDVTSFAVRADGQRVAWLGDVRVDGRQELFAAPLDGSAPDVALAGPIGAASDVTAVELGAHGRAVYRLDRGSAGPAELFAARLDGAGVPELLSSPPVPGGAVLSFRLGGGGTRVYYLADQEFDGSPELFLSLVRPRDHAR